MTALAVEIDSYWQARAKSAESRLTAEIQRCGRAEGERDVLREMLANRDATIATLRKDVDELQAELGAALDARDELLGRDA